MADLWQGFAGSLEGSVACFSVRARNVAAHPSEPCLRGQGRRGDRQRDLVWLGEPSGTRLGTFQHPSCGSLQGSSNRPNAKWSPLT